MQQTYFLGLFTICAGVPIVVTFSALMVFDLVRVLRGHRSVFNRYIPPPLPAPR